MASTEASQGLRKGRGRPKGSSTAVLRGTHWGLQHFAFLRSVEDGIDPASAWDRYLGFRGDSGQARGDPAAMLGVLCDDAIAMADRWRGAQRQAALAAVDTLRSTARAERPAPMSLEEFIVQEGIDPDFYTEAELIEQYQQATSPSPELKLRATMVEPSSAPARIVALRVLEPLIAKAPAGQDRLSAWLAPRMARLLGAGTVGELSRAMMGSGSAWPSVHRGVGRAQALRLADWLDSAFAPGHATALTSPRAAGRPRAKSAQSRPTLVALAERAGALVDESLEADAAWAAAYCLGRGAITRTEVERFMLWAWCVAGVGMSSVDAVCVERYLEWARRLTTADQDWVNPGGLERVDPRWRPFRKALGPRGEHNARAVLLRFVASARGSRRSANVTATAISR